MCVTKVFFNPFPAQCGGLKQGTSLLYSFGGPGFTGRFGGPFWLETPARPACPHVPRDSVGLEVLLRAVLTTQASPRRWRWKAELLLTPPMPRATFYPPHPPALTLARGPQDVGPPGLSGSGS